jgi:hypothetical protein
VNSVLDRITEGKAQIRQTIEQIADARAVLQDQKAKTGKPRAIIHDGLLSYDEAYS